MIHYCELRLRWNVRLPLWICTHLAHWVRTTFLSRARVGLLRISPLRASWIDSLSYYKHYLNLILDCIPLERYILIVVVVISRLLLALLSLVLMVPWCSISSWMLLQLEFLVRAEDLGFSRGFSPQKTFWYNISPGWLSYKDPRGSWDYREIFQVVHSVGDNNVSDSREKMW